MQIASVALAIRTGEEFEPIALATRGSGISQALIATGVRWSCIASGWVTLDPENGGLSVRKQPATFIAIRQRIFRIFSVCREGAFTKPLESLVTPAGFECVGRCLG